MDLIDPACCTAFTEDVTFLFRWAQLNLPTVLSWGQPDPTGKVRLMLLLLQKVGYQRGAEPCPLPTDRTHQQLSCPSYRGPEIQPH